MNIHNLPINQQNIIITMAVLLLPNNKSGLMCYYLLKIVKFFSLNYFSTSLNPLPPPKKKKKTYNICSLT